MTRGSRVRGDATDQTAGAERSLVTVGRSLTVGNGFPPLRTQHR